MQLNMLKSKIHRAVVVQAELSYVGGITVDKDLLERCRCPLRSGVRQNYHHGLLHDG